MRDRTRERCTSLVDYIRVKVLSSANSGRMQDLNNELI